jgi:branched-chain amino acid transport system permease protein
MVLGITFVLIMIFAPEGVIGKLRTIFTRKVS